MTRTAVIRADASPTIGGGHIVRCMSLADDLATVGWRCIFATEVESISTVPALERSAHETVILGRSSEPEAVWRQVGGPVDAVVVDHYEIGAAWESSCRGWTDCVVAIDDLADRPHSCDVLVDPTIGRSATDYQGLVPPDCGLLLGPDFAPLRAQFRAARDLHGRTRETIVVSFGTVDGNDMTSRAMAAATRVAPERPIDVILGSSAPHMERVRRLVDAHHEATLHVDIGDVAHVLSRAVVAFGAAGTSALERCCLGVPSIVIVAAENQKATARGLEERGAAISAGWHDAVTGDRLADLLADLLRSPHELARMRRAAYATCDGRGAERIAHRIDANVDRGRR